MWGIIGGTGFEKFEQVKSLGTLDGETPFGPASSGLKRVSVDGIEALFLPRHGEHHENLPSEVNYRANIFALKRHGAKRILSISAVGSLHKEYKPGDLVVPNQYVDRTKGIRKSSFCGEGIIGHVSLAKPACSALVAESENLSQKLDFDSHFRKTYVCVEGPYFSTQAESNANRALGAHIIGMTNFPEYGLAREAGLCYLPCCFVTDYDCWDDSIPHVTIQEVLECMKKNNSKAYSFARRLLHGSQKFAPCSCQEGGLRTGLFMPLEAIPPEKKWVHTLLQ